MFESINNLNILYHHRIRGQVESVHVVEMVKAFRKLGHAVKIIGPPSVNVEEIASGKVLSSTSSRGISRVLSHALNLDPFPASFEIKEHLYNFVALKNLYQMAKKRKIDFIYERYALNLWAGVFFAKRNNIPIIIEVNDATGIERVRKHVFQKGAAVIEKKVFNSADYIVTISSRFKRILIERGTAESKILVLPNAIDPDKFDPDSNTNIIGRDKIKKILKLDGKLTIGYVGQFVYWHGLDLLLEVIPKIVSKVPHVHFLLVGNGKQFDLIKERAYKTGLAEYVTFTGRVSHHDLPAYLSAMDIGVLPDSNIYGSPMKLFEYMAMRVVPVAPNLDPIKDVIVHGQNGVIFQRGDKVDFLRKLLKLVGDFHYRTRLAHGARQTVLRKHTWLRNATAILQWVHCYRLKGGIKKKKSQDYTELSKYNKES